MTDRLVASIKPIDKRQYIRDRDLSNLELQVTPAGTKTFYVCYRDGRTNRRHKLGTTKVISAAEARKMAKDVLVKLAVGQTFQSSSDQVTLRELIEKYIYHRKHVKKVSKTTIKNYEGELSRIKRALLNTPADDITRSAAHDEFDRFTRNGPVAANRMLALVRAAYNHGLSRGEVEKNPFAGISKNEEKPRKVFIPTEKLPDFWESLIAERIGGDIDAADCVVLMLFTGLRVSNALAITWQDVDLETGRVFIPRTKNGDEAVVYASGPALDMLRARRGFVGSKLVFDGRRSVRYSLARVNKNLAIQGLCAHAMRHTFTNVARKVIDDLKLIEVMTSHKTGSLTVNTYMHLEERELAEGFERVSREIVRLSRIAGNNFVVSHDSG